MSFGCECGYTWSGVREETRQHEGEYLSVVEREEWMDEASRAIASLAEASAKGMRDQWFDESKYFKSAYPRDLPDVEVFYDLLRNTRMSRGIDVYRCPKCQRVYLQEAADSSQYMKYQRVEG